jgi:mRNA-degrading endonuclease toxin of MazEF toxin-antitoxin module
MSEAKLEKTEADKLLERTISALTEFKNEFYGKDDDSSKKTLNYLEWIKLKTELVQNESAFVIPPEKNELIKRQYVHWFHFGFNIGKEFGGHHPAVILKDTGDSVFVLPLSSGKIPENKKDKPYCVDIPFVYDMAAMPRWANVYRIVCVSKMRIDFSSGTGRLQGKYMDKINEAMDKSGIKI